ncbi:MAG: threonylcarbamoyl-AMP synthase [Alistipes sp.]|jgi:tRNA threonylcarbamoyl adenosine modification protein (Sua5/YciO/YrdC/YwlC family)|nr:threonylcarbamoyl-AMP synthase [Alistipes sp.]
MIVRIWPDNPNPKQIAHAAEVLRADGVIAYPTDSVYALGCSLHNPKAIERMRTIKGKDASVFTLVFDSLARIADFARVDNPQFRVLKHNLPGPFTFLLSPLSRVPEKALARRKSIGVRVPSNPIARALIAELGCPMLTTSVKDDDEFIEYTTDPELIHERYLRMVDMVIDGGIGASTPTTVVDLTGDEPEILREGLGELRY